MSIIKNYHDKKWTLQFLDALYNSIDNITCHNGERVSVPRKLTLLDQDLHLSDDQYHETTCNMN
jgi:hypothetical protein